MSISIILGKLAEGFVMNCEIFAVTLIAGLPLGLLISFGTMSSLPPIRWITKTFVWIIRGTPLMLQVIIVFFGPGLLLHSRPIGRLNAVFIAFIINYACYFSEIFRGGIQSVPAGQREAGQVLGMTKTQIFFRVTLLQVIKRVVPPMGNEFISLVKDTSLARIIANREILMYAQEYVTKGLIWPLFASGLFFLAANGILTLLLAWSEKKLDYFR